MSDETWSHLNAEKLGLIDHLGKESFSTFADLGAVWAVDAGYTFYTLESYPIERAVLVDTDLSDAVVAKAPLFPQLQIIQA